MEYLWIPCVFIIADVLALVVGLIFMCYEGNSVSRRRRRRRRRRR